MKRALYYAIRTGSLYNPVIAVTSERGRRWSGRDCPHGHVTYYSTTHGTMSDLSGRFETENEAFAMRRQIAALSDSYDESRKVLALHTSQLHARERNAMAELLKGIDPGPAPRPVVIYDKSAVQLNERGWHLPSINEGLRIARVHNNQPLPGDLPEGEPT